MFTYKLNEKEKHALANLLITLAASDGDFQEEEREIIVTYASSLGSDVSADKSSRSIKEICSDFSSYQSRIIALQKLMELSVSDDFFHENEIKLIMEISKNMGLTEEILVEVEQWARNYMHICKQGKDMLTQLS
ncbi:MAG: TerB family tellurite resistance protein [Alphaproteobacteria bacterium]|nr:TerB family tellurite resistance protein [Alphaproteobacteria bacterium]